MMSGFLDPSAQAELDHPVLMKPFAPPELLRRVREALDGAPIPRSSA